MGLGGRWWYRGGDETSGTSVLGKTRSGLVNVGEGGDGSRGIGLSRKGARAICSGGSCTVGMAVKYEIGPGDAQGILQVAETDKVRAIPLDHVAAWQG